MFRIGFGQDSHRFSKDPSKKLVLGGVIFEGAQGLEGNSDGDAVIHALCRAMEQATGGESFSIYSDKMVAEGIKDSILYLQAALKNIAEKGYKLNNIGISIEAKVPKIDPIAEKIKAKLAKILELEDGQIGINATSGEELTSFGRGEGIQVFAIVSLQKNKMP